MTNHQLMESMVEQVVKGPIVGAVMNAFDVCFESASHTGCNYDDMKKMALKLLGEANAFNVMHWNATTNTRHSLLNDVYDLCRDTGDTLAETYMSVTEKACEPDDGDAMSADNCDEKKALSRMKALQAEMQATVKRNSGYSEGIKNIFADFDESITSIIYKYQQFTA